MIFKRFFIRTLCKCVYKKCIVTIVTLNKVFYNSKQADFNFCYVFLFFFFGGEIQFFSFFSYNN